MLFLILFFCLVTSDHSLYAMELKDHELNLIARQCADLSWNHFRSFGRNQEKTEFRMNCLNTFIQSYDHFQKLAFDCLRFVHSLGISSHLPSPGHSTHGPVTPQRSSTPDPENQSKTEVISPPPTLMELLDGTFYYLESDHHPDFRGVKKGDILFEKLKALGPAAFSEHVLISNESKTPGVNSNPILFLDHIHATAAGIHYGAGFPFAEDANYFAYRLANEEVTRNMMSFASHQADQNGKYSYLKALKSFFTGGVHKIDTSDQKRILVNLLRHYLTLSIHLPALSPKLNSNLRQIAIQSMKSANLYYHPGNREICSTFAGNSLLLGALKTKIDHPKSKNSILGFHQKLSHLREFLSHLSADGAELTDKQIQKVEKQIASSADQLLRDRPFIQLMEFETSPVFQQNLNRMLPRNLFRFLSRMSKNGCRYPQRLLLEADKKTPQEL